MARISSSSDSCEREAKEEMQRDDHAHWFELMTLMASSSVAALTMVRTGPKISWLCATKGGAKERVSTCRERSSLARERTSGTHV